MATASEAPQERRKREEAPDSDFDYYLRPCESRGWRCFSSPARAPWITASSAERKTEVPVRVTRRPAGWARPAQGASEALPAGGTTGAAGTISVSGTAGTTTTGVAGMTSVAGAAGAAGSTSTGASGSGLVGGGGSSGGGTGAFKVQYECRNNSTAVAQLEYSIKIVNTGTTTISLSAVSVRYWYTIDGTGAQAGQCASAAHPCTIAFESTTATATADQYAVITFSGGTLAPGADTGEIQIQTFATGTYNQANDYSFSDTGANFVDDMRLTGYESGQLVWGQPPAAGTSGAAGSGGTAGSTGTAGATGTGGNTGAGGATVCMNSTVKTAGGLETTCPAKTGWVATALPTPPSGLDGISNTLLQPPYAIDGNTGTRYSSGNDDGAGLLFPGRHGRGEAGLGHHRGYERGRRRGRRRAGLSGRAVDRRDQLHDGRVVRVSRCPL